MGMDDKKHFCPILDVDGVISGGKQFDLDITLPEDNRDIIYGVVKDCFKEPVDNAVVKLVEVVCEHGKEERRPIGHTFTDEEGEFVFGPLCPGKEYALQAPVTLEQLLLELGYRTKLVAVERNNSIVKRAAYASTVLSDADKLEIVSFVGGG